MRRGSTFNSVCTQHREVSVETQSVREIKVIAEYCRIMLLKFRNMQCAYKCFSSIYKYKAMKQFDQNFYFLVTATKCIANSDKYTLVNFKNVVDAWRAQTVRKRESRRTISRVAETRVYGFVCITKTKRAHC